MDENRVMLTDAFLELILRLRTEGRNARARGDAGRNAELRAAFEKAQEEACALGLDIKAELELRNVSLPPEDNP